MSLEPHERIFVALDTPELERARTLVSALRGRVGGFKVGLELFTSHGPRLVHEILDSGSQVFLDLKFHDIPNTVAGSAAAATRCGASFFTVHASGGQAMIRRAVEAAGEAAEASGRTPPIVLAVTVLTSHDDAELDDIGLAGPCGAAVLRLAGLAREAGAGGLVCSPLELGKIRAAFPEGVVVVPGIRPAGLGAVARDDQSRTATPASAVAAGADRLVIGRPITRAEDPAGAAEAIAEEVRLGESS
jgi:orotidine-5'-phosphate decarboxylase